MVYQNFFNFLILLAVTVVVTAAKVVLGKEKPKPFDLSVDLVFCYFGAWVGTAVFGRWFEGIAYQDISIIPALLGAISALVLKTACYRRGAA
jgi:uncharacterized membrane protein YeaQ/YmgE (transglycosylase-associated protein family)